MKDLNVENPNANTLRQTHQGERSEEIQEGLIRSGTGTTNSPLIYAAFGPVISQISGYLRTEGSVNQR